MNKNTYKTTGASALHAAESIIEQANKKLNRLGFSAALATIGSVEKVKEQRQSLPVK